MTYARFLDSRLCRFRSDQEALALTACGLALIVASEFRHKGSPGLWAIRAAFAPTAPLLVLMVAAGIGLTMALVAQLALDDAARHDRLRAAVLMLLIPAITLPSADLWLVLAALPPSIVRARRSHDRVTPWLLVAAASAASLGLPWAGAPALLIAAARTLPVTARRAANDNRPNRLAASPVTTGWHPSERPRMRQMWIARP